MEDGFKIYGMIAYSYYWIITAKQMVSGNCNDRPKPSAESQIML